MFDIKRVSLVGGNGRITGTAGFNEEFTEYKHITFNMNDDSDANGNVDASIRVTCNFKDTGETIKEFPLKIFDDG